MAKLSPKSRVRVDLTKLPRGELVQMQALIATLLGGHQSQAAEASEPSAVEREVYGWMSLIMAEESGSRPPPFNIFRASSAYPTFKAGAPVFYTYLQKHFSVGQRVDRTHLALLLLRLLARRLRELGRPVVMGTMGYEIKNFGEWVERAFPGYRASGKLSAVFTAAQLQAKVRGGRG